MRKNTGPALNCKAIHATSKTSLTNTRSTLPQQSSSCSVAWCSSTCARGMRARLICIECRGRKGVLREVRALAFFLPLRRLPGDDACLIPCGLLEALLVTRLKTAGKVQTSKFAEERHHLHYGSCDIQERVAHFEQAHHHCSLQHSASAAASSAPPACQAGGRVGQLRRKANDHGGGLSPPM